MNECRRLRSDNYREGPARRYACFGVGLLALGFVAAVSAAPPSSLFDTPIDCRSCADWNEPQAPFRIHGDTYYVGTAGLASILVDTGDGLLLFDGGLPQSAPLIDANIRALGFRTEDVVRIFLSHAHYDHAGGVAALQRVSGAPLTTHAAALATVREGRLQPDDPQYDPASPTGSFPPVDDLRAAADGEIIAVGDVSVRAIHTPGHTPGGMTWTWRSCEDGDCLHVVYADSLTPVAAEGYRFSDGAAGDVEASAAKVAGLDCDVLFATHPGFLDMQEKLDAGGEKALLDPEACEQYAADVMQQLERRLRRELDQAGAGPL